MTNIDYYFSVLSPFTYLADDRLEAIASRHGVGIKYKPFNIVEVFAKTGGTAPKDRHASRQAYRLQDLARTARMNGMDINLAPAHWPTNPEPASVAIILASRKKSGDIGKLVRAILGACWSQDRDIAENEVIVNCLESAGHDRSLATWIDDSAIDEYRQNTREAVSRNVFGAPSYLVGDQVFWGQDRLSHLDAWLGGKLS